MDRDTPLFRTEYPEKLPRAQHEHLQGNFNTTYAYPFPGMENVTAFAFETGFKDFRERMLIPNVVIDDMILQTTWDVYTLQMSYACCTVIALVLGFTMLNTGSVTVKNVTTMLKVSIIETLIVSFCTWALGIQIATDAEGGLYGTNLHFGFFDTVTDD